MADGSLAQAVTPISGHAVFLEVTFPIGAQSEVESPSSHISVEAWVVGILLDVDEETCWREVLDVGLRSRVVQVSRGDFNIEVGLLLLGRIAVVHVGPRSQIFSHLHLSRDIWSAAIFLVSASVSSTIIAIGASPGCKSSIARACSITHLTWANITNAENSIPCGDSCWCLPPQPTGNRIFSCEGKLILEVVGFGN